MTPPNLREADCCAICDGKSKSTGLMMGTILCIRFNRWKFLKSYNICDDFKREE